MKLSTRSRYGTRMMVELARNYEKGPVQMRDISRRQRVSAKYLEQLIIPLKRADLIKSVRGPKGGHMLSRSPEEIRVGEIVRLLEGRSCLVNCLEDPSSCEMAQFCKIRNIWAMASRAVYEKLNAITLLDMVKGTEVPPEAPRGEAPDARSTNREGADDHESGVHCPQ